MLPALISVHLLRRHWLDVAGPVGVLAEAVTGPVTCLRALLLQIICSDTCGPMR